MKKTVLLAATATLSAGLIGVAAVASASGPSSGAVPPASSSTVEVHHGADDLAAPTPFAVPAPAAVPTPTAGGRNGADDPVRHDVGDDHGVDDPAAHDVGDDHGRHGGHGADD